MNVIKDNDHCGFMYKTNGPFKDCDPALVDTHHQDCVYDSCALKDNMAEQVCDALAALWLACGDDDIVYRSLEMCPPSRCFTQE